MTDATEQEYTSLMPELSDLEYQALKADIEERGVLVPIQYDEVGHLLDGRHRLRAARELGIDDYPTVVVQGLAGDLDTRRHVRKINLLRRQLTQAQRREIIADALRDEPQRSDRAHARDLGVSDKTVATVRRKLEEIAEIPQFDSRVDSRSGKPRKPATKPARDVRPGDIVTDDSGDTREVSDVEDTGTAVVIHDDNGDAIIADPEQEIEAKPGITKPDLGGISHPARYSDAILPVLQEAVPAETYPHVLDPFAGTGRIHSLTNETAGVEIEPEWAQLHPDTIVGDATLLPFDDNSYDAIVTSPTYGNRLADSHNASDPETRRSYTHDLGRKLTPGNSGEMQWGDTYRDLHEAAWAEAKRVLRPGGRLVLNIKDHIRGGRRQHVAGWHVTYLIRQGFELVYCTDVATRSLRQGENSDLRLTEQVFVFDLPAKP